MRIFWIRRAAESSRWELTKQILATIPCGQFQEEWNFSS